MNEYILISLSSLFILQIDSSIFPPPLLSIYSFKGHSWPSSETIQWTFQPFTWWTLEDLPKCYNWSAVLPPLSLSSSLPINWDTVIVKFGVLLEKCKKINILCLLTQHTFCSLGINKQFWISTKWIKSRASQMEILSKALNTKAFNLKI